jgi:uncharacterized protein
MLEVDLAQLDRERRVEIRVDVAAGELGIDRPDSGFDGPVAVRLEAVRAGADVLVRGHVSFPIVLPCRRCLTPVARRIADEVTLLFREDAEPDGGDDVWPLPARARVLELVEPMREHVVLAAPAYALCAGECKGLCPHCGVNRNDMACNCAPAPPDERWAALREWKSE